MGATDKKENSPMLSKIPLGTKFNEEHSSHEQPPRPWIEVGASWSPGLFYRWPASQLHLPASSLSMCVTREQQRGTLTGISRDLQPLIICIVQ